MMMMADNRRLKLPTTLAEAEATERLEQRETAEKLKIILAKAEAAVAQGLPLTVKEEQLLAELYRRRYLKPREAVTVDSAGAVHVNKTVDAEPVMDAMKAYGDFIDKYSTRKAAQRIVGSIDPITAANWAKESKTKIGSKEFVNFCMKRIKNDIDYRRFRVGN